MLAMMTVMPPMPGPQEIPHKVMIKGEDKPNSGQISYQGRLTLAVNEILTVPGFSGLKTKASGFKGEGVMFPMGTSWFQDTFSKVAPSTISPVLRLTIDTM